MGWADRMHKKNNKEKQAEEMINEILNHPKYLEIKEKYRSEAVLDAYCACCIATSEFLEEEHRYGRKRLLKYLDFMIDRLELMDNEKYLLGRVEHHKEKHELDIPKEMNVEFDLSVDDLA